MVVTERSDNAIPPEPVIVIVLVEPVPEAVTPDPTKFNVVAEVDNELPSSCTVIAAPTVPGSQY